MQVLLRTQCPRGGRLLAAALGLAVTAGVARAQQPPNLVLILADDLGWGDLACQGGAIPTPHLDALAAAGVRFTSCYVSQAACTPSRAAILTGCHANRVGLPDVLFPGAKVGLHPDEETLPELLRRRGYVTGAFGKWHLGDAEPCAPQQHGFDEFLGLPYSNDMWPVDFAGQPVPAGHAKNRYPPLHWWDGRQALEPIATLADQAEITGRLTAAAVDFVRRHRDRPFFLYLPHPMPHVPIAAGAGFAGRSGHGLYGDVIQEIDASVGAVVAALAEAGVRERTLVVFTSDNGPWLNFGDHAGSAGPLREGKGTTWEGGARVPCVMALPGVIPPGSVSSRIVATVDLLPTLCGLAGAEPPRRRIDGIDLAALLRDPSDPEPRQEYWFYYGRDLQAVRAGRWKLHLPHDYRSYAGQAPGSGGRPGPTATRRTGLELYDLERDPGERNDVRREHPHLVHALLERAAAARADLGDGTVGPGCRPPWRAP